MTDTKVQEVKGKESKLDATARILRLSGYGLEIARDYVINIKAQSEKVIDNLNSMIELLKKSPLLKSKE